MQAEVAASACKYSWGIFLPAATNGITALINVRALVAFVISR
jgi:hypothetical protein